MSRAIWLVLLALSACAQAQVYNVIDLGYYVFPVGINSLGHVAATGKCPTCGFNYHAVLWTPEGGLQDLGTLPGDLENTSTAGGINGLDQVTGSAGFSIDGNPICCHAFLWTPGEGMKDVAAPPSGCGYQGIAVNDQSQVVGIGSPYIGGSSLFCSNFLWTAGEEARELGLPPDALTVGVGGLNNRGMVVGGYSSALDFLPRSYIWTSVGGYRDLGIGPSEASGINNRGHVIGQYNIKCTFCSTGAHAYLWDRQHGVRDLGVLPGQINSWPHGLNARDEVVGYSALFYTGPYPFLWTESTGMVNLNTLIDGSSGWQLIDAVAINNREEIAGWGYLNGQYHGFLLRKQR